RVPPGASSMCFTTEQGHALSLDQEGWRECLTTTGANRHVCSNYRDTIASKPRGCGPRSDGGQWSQRSRFIEGGFGGCWRAFPVRRISQRNDPNARAGQAGRPPRDDSAAYGGNGSRKNEASSANSRDVGERDSGMSPIYTYLHIF